MMLEKMADLEVFEVVATLDFAHRHMGQAASSCGRRINENEKVLKPNPFFMELEVARQPSGGTRDWNDLILMKPAWVSCFLGQG
jgi:hypothetical protein